MPLEKSKNHTLRFTDAQWAAWQSQSEQRGYSGPNAIMAAIADGDLPIGLESPKLNTYAERLVRLDGEISGIWNAIEELRRIVAGAQPRTPTELP